MAIFIVLLQRDHARLLFTHSVRPEDAEQAPR
jgi:hypothetical protein